MVHGIKQPIKEDAAKRGTTQVVRHASDEQKIDQNITLRRTTIEEIELKPGADPSKVKPEDVSQAPEQDRPT